jgi:hypothetical protein
MRNRPSAAAVTSPKPPLPPTDTRALKHERAFTVYLFIYLFLFFFSYASVRVFIIFLLFRPRRGITTRARTRPSSKGIIYRRRRYEISRAHLFYTRYFD